MLSSFLKGTAAVPSLMYPAHLSNAVRCNKPEQSRSAMQIHTSLINFCGIPEDVGPTFCNASPTALKKKETGVRPIAVGEVLRRLMANCLVSFAKEEAFKIFFKNQLGVATRDGEESIIHATKLIYVDCGKGESLGVLQIDFENAFNSIKRQGVLSECRKQ